MSTPTRRTRILTTSAVVILAAIVLWLLYVRSVRHPWTRDGQVAANIVLIAPRVSGHVVRVDVENDQRVGAGDLLFRIDPSRFRLTVESARVRLDEARQQVRALEAAVGAAEAAVDQAGTGVETARARAEAARFAMEAARTLVAAADAGLGSAQAAIDQARAQLDESIRERDRAATLADQGAGSVQWAESRAAATQSAAARLAGAEAGLRAARADHERALAGQLQAESELLVATSGIEDAQARLASALAGLEQAQANLGEPGEDNVRIRAAKASLADAELDLAWTDVRAPSDGRVTNVNVNVGDSATAAQSMLAFVEQGSYYVQGFFRETQLRRISIGDRAIVTLMGHPGTPIEGVVESIDRAVNPPNIAQTGAAGDSGIVPQVQPSFDWIRLPQRVPVRIRIERVPDDVRLVAGTTASIAIQPEK
jgi:multidrug resistance efflux pump